MRSMLLAVTLVLLLWSVDGLAQCPPDTVWAEVRPEVVLVHHDSAEFNCCPELEHEVVVDGFTVDVFEVEVTASCFCTCCFDLVHQLADLPPGAYQVRVWGAYGCDPDPCGTTQFTVEQGEGPSSAMTLASACGGWGGAELIFADGFASGDTHRWEASEPR